VVTHRTADGRAVRYEYEPVGRTDWKLTEYIQTRSGDWRPVGTERITSLSVETPD